MSSTLLSINSLCFSYEPGRNSILEAVSFEIHPQTITVILGPNGAGKTTLLHLLLGLRKPHSGTILLEDLPLVNYSRRELSQWMGLVPQSEHVPFEYSVLEFVLLGRAPYLGPLELPGSEDIQIAKNALLQVGIQDLEKRPIPALSGGEHQLVLIARALAQQPKILLLDEPTSHLDLSNRNKTLKILNQLRLAGSTIIFTTHDPEAASLIADNLVLMRLGKVLHTGSIDLTFTSEKLSETYGTPIDVIRMEGRRIVQSLGSLS
ncbi:MAG: ABC transporter ATP-binding protein [Chloroflexi bacterium]|nr:ABC transporter ATP-binding protein [Chloroflexota bacterium]